MITIERWDEIQAGWTVLWWSAADVLAEKIFSPVPCRSLDWGLPVAESGLPADDVAFIKTMIATRQPYLQLAGPLDGPPSSREAFLITEKEGYATPVRVRLEVVRGDTQADAGTAVFKHGVSGSPFVERGRDTFFVTGVVSSQVLPAGATQMPTDGTSRAYLGSLRCLQGTSPGDLLGHLAPAGDEVLLARLCVLGKKSLRPSVGQVRLLVDAASASLTSGNRDEFNRLVVEMRFSLAWRSTAEVLTACRDLIQGLSVAADRRPTTPEDGLLDKSVRDSDAMIVIGAAASARAHLTDEEFSETLASLVSPDSSVLSPKSRNFLKNSIEAIKVKSGRPFEQEDRHYAGLARAILEGAY